MPNSTPALLLLCGALFLFEASAGFFFPGLYRLVEPNSEGRRSPLLRVAGGTLALCGLVFVLLSLPPKGFAQAFLIVFGAACLFKGLMMILRPDALRDTPAHIRERPALWRWQCAFRALIGVVILAWGIATWAAEG